LGSLAPIHLRGKKCTQDFILRHFQPPLRGWSRWQNPTRDYVLGYYQPSLSGLSSYFLQLSSVLSATMLFKQRDNLDWLVPKARSFPENSHQTILASLSGGQNRNKVFDALVPGGGVEPPRGCPRRI
jgi:hypothetical protein